MFVSVSVFTRLTKAKIIFLATLMLPMFEERMTKSHAARFRKVEPGFY